MKKFLLFTIIINISFLTTFAQCQSLSDEHLNTISKNSNHNTRADSTIKSTKGANDIKIFNAYPNPAKSYIVFQYSFPPSINNVRIEIRNILGSVIHKINLTGGTDNYRLETKSLNDGIYFYSIVINEQVYTTKKLVIKH